MDPMTYYVAYQWNDCDSGLHGFGSTFLDFPNEVAMGKGLVLLIQKRIKDSMDDPHKGNANHSIVILNMTRMEGP